MNSLKASNDRIMKSPMKKESQIEKMNLLLTSKKVVVNDKLKNVVETNRYANADLFHKFMGRGIRSSRKRNSPKKVFNTAYIDEKIDKILNEEDANVNIKSPGASKPRFIRRNRSTKSTNSMS
tara:strand:+ start:336 stop:704 length:369 start_codon:yes stop_codon:yes gene_type:complete